MPPLALAKGPAAEKARNLLRALREDLATLRPACLDDVERGALALLLGHLEQGYEPDSVGSA